jgi:hypothetical protein
MPRAKLWKGFKQIGSHPYIHNVMIRMYEKVISDMQCNNKWSMDSNCNIGVKQGWPLSPTTFGIYISKIEKCLEEDGCIGINIIKLIVIPLLYIDDISLITKIIEAIQNKFKLL